MGVIINRQREASILAFSYRLKAANIDVNFNDLTKKLHSLPIDELNDLMSNFMSFNQNEKIETLRKLGIPAADKTETINKLKDEVKKSLNLSDITEFENQHKRYFKFKDASGNITVVRNLGYDSKELFTSILNNTNLANNQDGKKNTSEIFKFLKNNQFIEIPLENSTDIDTNKHSKTQISIVKEIEKQFPDKQIVTGLKENLYIVKGNNGEDDIILSIKKENRKYKVTALEQKSYGAKPELSTEKENIHSKTEVPNDIIIELEKNEEIAQIIEDGLNSNLTDEQISNNTNNIIETKYPKFKNIPNLASIIMTLINKKKNNRGKGAQSNSLGGRQYILTNNKLPVHSNEYSEVA